MNTASPDLIQALSEGVFERPIWHGFLERLCASTGSVYVALTFRTFRNETIALHAGQGPPAELHALVERNRLRRGLPPWRPPGTDSFGLESLFETSDPDEETQIRKRLRALGIEFVRIQQIGEPSGVQAWLTCAGAAQTERFTSDLMTQMVPFIKQALRTYLTLERERFSSAIMIEAARRSNFGWLVLDRNCRIIDQTPEMDEIFSSSRLLRRDDENRLRFRNTAIRRQVDEIVGRFAHDPSGKPQALVLNRDPWMDILVAPVLNRSILAESTPVAIVYMRSDRQSHAEHCERLADLFGMSAREAQMAWVLAQGTSIAEAARDLGISTETARSYSKKVYSKTGVHRQAELVRVILTSMSAIG